MEGTKKIIASRIRPLVFDDSLIGLGKPLYFFQDAALRIQEIGLTLPDGEVGVSWFDVSVARGERASKNIETAADTVNDCASLGVDDGIGRREVAYPVELFSGLRIGIDHDGIRLVSPPRDDTFLQLWQLGYGPIDSSFSV